MRDFLVRIWRALTAPHPGLRHPIERRQATLLASLLLPLTFVAIASGILGLTVPEADAGFEGIPASLLGIGAAPFLLVAYAFSRTRHHLFGAILAVSTSAIGAWSAVLLLRGSDYWMVVTPFLVIAVALSTLLLPTAFTAALAALVVLGLLALPFLPPEVPFGFVVTPLSFVVMVCTLVLVAAARRDADEKHLAESESRFRALSDATLEGVCVHHNGVILDCNQAFATLFGHRHDSMRGRHVIDLVDESSRADVAARLRDPRDDAYEVTVRRRDGTPFIVEVSARDVLYRGQFARVTAVRDVTARHEAEEARRRSNELQVANAQLVALDRSKTQFVNTAAHELNTPITPIRLQVHMLKSAPDLTPVHRRSLEVVERNVTRLASLVADLLDIARADSGHLALKVTSVDLADLAREAAESFEGPAAAAGLVLESDLPASPLMVQVDPRRIQQVFDNLLTNALKFTPAGGRVHLEARAIGHTVIVLVRDTGDGLDPDQLARLFQPFSQVHDPVARNVGGTGLGLSICRRILEGHGGSIWAESPGHGRGTTFAFSLPLPTPVPLRASQAATDV